MKISIVVKKKRYILLLYSKIEDFFCLVVGRFYRDIKLMFFLATIINNDNKKDDDNHDNHRARGRLN